jgi:UDPglucose 6-dehydrogenase
MVGIRESSDAATNPQIIAVIGGGYVGSPTAAMLAHFGHQVTVAESQRDRREQLAAGRTQVMEEGLADLLASTIERGRLRVVADAAEAVAGARFVFLCVATPMGDDGRADLSEIDAAARQIRSALAPGAIVVNKSTVPVGTAERVADIIGRSDVDVVSNPEFLSEGTAVRNSFSPDRTVVGGSNSEAVLAVGELFAPTGAPLVATDARSAELAKYAANAFLATKLSFVNSVAQLCDAVGADIDDVVDALGRDPRIGSSFLRPGPGWGGPCLPKDASAMLAISTDAAVDTPVVAAAIVANELQRQHIVSSIVSMIGESAAGATVALLGLTFKAGTSDRRMSPALAVAHALAARGAVVRAYDPTVETNDTSEDLGGLVLCASVAEAAREADVAVVATEWTEFAAFDFVALGATMRTARLYDARGVVDLAAARAAGFTAAALGRP